MSAIRWGILSTGNMARQFVEDFQYSQGGILKAVCSRQQKDAESFAGEFGLEYAYSSLDNMLEKGQVDIVYIASPHSHHYDAAMTAIRAGIPVLCEKPMTLTLQETEALYEAADKAGVFLMEALWSRFNPAIAEAVDMVRQGRIGEVKSVQANFGFAADVPDSHRLLNPALGGGALLDVGIYPLFLSLLMLGDVKKVQSRVETGATGVDLYEDIWLEHEEGRTSSLTASIDRYLPNTAVISGSKGYIEFPSHWFAARSLRYYREGEEAEWYSFDFPGNGWHFEATHVNECLLSGQTKSPVYTPEDSIRLAATVDCLLAQWKS
ncbi:Gfo/Idh/MocA family protein [Hahella ganghwensis]|uniref:Gfo/Idh/MocA family protein n=1 Tax=Hahella ganghwensis TaxID=286420 RepID=UPI000527613F|nr:Gfo/Idh/MocA family oxidoreductase [Hahella ganghwensis]